MESLRTRKSASDDPYGLLKDMPISLEDVTSQLQGLRLDILPEELRPLPAVGDEACALCWSGLLRRGTSGIDYVCDGCGLVVEGDPTEPDDDEAPRAAPNVARLRIVGAGSSQLQPDLYRSGPGNTAAVQRKQIYEEYCAYRAMHIERGRRAFPLDACSRAADMYNDGVQRTCVKRSQNKKSIMAACLYRACIKIGFSPQKSEIAEFMQLQSKGIARGDNVVRSLIADGKMADDSDEDDCRPAIRTLFAQLGLESEKFNDLRAAVYEIVQTAIAANIGVSSLLHSKVAAATFVALSRSQGSPTRQSLQDFCQRASIRKNTVERMLKQIESYHSHFVDCYTRTNLDARPRQLV